jgi:Domain of unknown function (DUF5666)
MNRSLLFALVVGCTLTAACESDDSGSPTLPSSTDRAAAGISTTPRNLLRSVGGIQNADAAVEGPVTRLTGECPVMFFAVRLTVVRTNAVSNIDDGCSDLENGVVVEVQGKRQRDGSILATRIEREDDDDDDDDDGPRR